MDGTVMAEEIIAAWQRKGTRKFLWTVDMVKVYDSLHLNFLYLSMKRRGFLKEWISNEVHYLSHFFYIGEECLEGGWTNCSGG